MSFYTCTLPSVQSWLGRELELRGIDAMIYTRYILSILQQENRDVERELQQSPVTKDVRRHRGKSPKQLRNWNVEELKKHAVVECLQSVVDQECDIENLVDELCSRLRRLQAEQTAGCSLVSTQTDIHSADSESISEDDAERYYEAFPALGDSSTDVPPEPKPWGSWAMTCKKESPKDKVSDQEISSSRSSTQPSPSKPALSILNAGQSDGRLATSATNCKKSPVMGSHKNQTPEASNTVDQLFKSVLGDEEKAIKEQENFALSSVIHEMETNFDANGYVDNLDVASTKEDLKWYTDPVGQIFTPSSNKSKLQTLYKQRNGGAESQLDDTAQAFVESICHEAISEALKAEQCFLKSLSDGKEGKDNLEVPGTGELLSVAVTTNDPAKTGNDAFDTLQIDATIFTDEKNLWKTCTDEQSDEEKENVITTEENDDLVQSPSTDSLCEVDGMNVHNRDEKYGESKEKETISIVDDLFGPFNVNLAAIWDSPITADAKPKWSSPITTTCQQSQEGHIMTNQGGVSDDKSDTVLTSPVKSGVNEGNDSPATPSVDSNTKSLLENNNIDTVWPLMIEKPGINSDLLTPEAEEILDESDCQRVLSLDSWQCVPLNDNPTTETNPELSDTNGWDVNNAMWSTYDLQSTLIQPPKLVTYGCSQSDDSESRHQFIPGGVYGNINLKAGDIQAKKPSHPISCAREIWETDCICQYFPSSYRDSSRFEFAQGRRRPQSAGGKPSDFEYSSLSRLHSVDDSMYDHYTDQFDHKRTELKSANPVQFCNVDDERNVQENERSLYCNVTSTEFPTMQEKREVGRLSLHEMLKRDQHSGMEFQDLFYNSEDFSPRKSATFTNHQGAFTKIIPKKRTDPIVYGSSWSGPIGRGKTHSSLSFPDCQDEYSTEMLAWENLLISPKTHFKPIRESFSSDSLYECDGQSSEASQHSSIRNCDIINVDKCVCYTENAGGVIGQFAHSAPDSLTNRADQKIKYFLSQCNHRWSTGSDDAEIENYTTHMPHSQCHKTYPADVTHTKHIQVIDHKAGNINGNSVFKGMQKPSVSCAQDKKNVFEEEKSNFYGLGDISGHSNLLMDREEQIFTLEELMPETEESFEEQIMLYSSDLESEWLLTTPPEMNTKKKPRKGSSRKPCSFYLEGSCHRADCKFAHDLSNITCRFWEGGTCFKGVDCPFLHGYPSESRTQSDGSNSSSFIFDTQQFPELSKSSKDKSSSSNESTPPGTLGRRTKGVYDKKKPPGMKHKKSLPINIDYRNK
ncbi:uncharacterized protein LOC144446344 [Glandiceps talaboti]